MIDPEHSDLVGIDETTFPSASGTPPTDGQGRGHGKMLIIGAVELGVETSRAAWGWPKCLPMAPATSVPLSKPPSSPRPGGWSVYAGFLLTIAKSILSARRSLISSSRVPTKPSPTSGDGREVFAIGCTVNICMLVSASSPSALTNPKPPCRFPTALRPRCQSKAPCLQHVNQTGIKCISSLCDFHKFPQKTEFGPIWLLDEAQDQLYSTRTKFGVATLGHWQPRN